MQMSAYMVQLRQAAHDTVIRSARETFRAMGVLTPQTPHVLKQLACHVSAFVSAPRQMMMKIYSHISC